jgi:hypothetical protein
MLFIVTCVGTSVLTTHDLIWALWLSQKQYRLASSLCTYQTMDFYFVPTSDTNRFKSHDLRNIYTRLEQVSAVVPLHTRILEI